jgi:hypothetical protein
VELPLAFPPGVVVEVKALACELPHRRGLPLSRFSVAEIRREVLAEGLVAEISGTTLWRWLSRDALCPWRYRSWIFPRDPDFATKAGRVLDLYAGRWNGTALGRRDFVLSADEKTSIQARRRIHGPLPPAPGRATRVEHEYTRGGAWAYLAAWDVHRAKVFGRCETTTGIEPFDRLVAQVMSEEPYRSARRVFWITDNGSSHRGDTACRRLQSCRQRGPRSSWSTRQFTPAGSTKSKCISPSSNGRSSRRTTSCRSSRSRNGCAAFSSTTSTPPSHSVGRSPDPISPSSWPSSIPKRGSRRRRERCRKYVTVIVEWST